MSEWKWQIGPFAWSFEWTPFATQTRQTMGGECFASWHRIVWRLWWCEAVVPHGGRYWEAVNEWLEQNNRASRR